MKNLLSTSKSYKDPKVYRDLKIGFACVVILGILIAFAVSPKLRHEIGIGVGPAHPISTSKVHHKTHHQSVLTKVSHNGHGQKIHSGHQSHAHGYSHKVKGNHPVNGQKGSEGVTTPHPSHPTHPIAPPPSSGGSNLTPVNSVTPPPTTPPPGHPSENNGKAVGIEAGKAKVEVPIVEVPPVLEETTHGASETVHGVTGTVEETTKQLPVHAEVPKVCVPNC